MFFDIALYIALIIFGLGMVYRLFTWFLQNVGMVEGDIRPAKRVYGAMKGILGTVFSRKILSFLKVFVLDVLLQLKILRDRKDRILWVSHIFIFVGFILLLLMHALGGIITSSLFSDYQSTLNPFMFLRNLFGALVISGLVLAIIRRRILLKKGRLRTISAMNYYAIVILAIIIVSGFLLEGVKISSYSAYQRMVEDYTSATEDSEAHALEAFWVENFGVVSPKTQMPFSAEMLAQGKELHEMSCADCHSRPKWAFISYSVSRATKSIALGIDKARVQTVLWYVHFLSCFFGMAYFAFSKMFHAFATPLSLLVTAAEEKSKEAPENVSTRQMIELAGCSYCSTCRLECPVRQKRWERIEMTPEFGLVLEYVGQKNWKDLGSRYVAG